MRPKQHRVDLTETERAELLLLTRAGTAKAQVIRRAHILVRAGEGAVDAETAQALHIARACSDAPTGRVQWIMQLLADKLVALDVIDVISDETVRRTLGEKSAQAVAETALLHGARGRRLRLAPGGRARPLCRSARSRAAPALLR